MRFAIHFDGSIPLADIANALAGVGIHLRTEPSGRMVADNVPRIIRREAGESVVQIAGRKRRP